MIEWLGFTPDTADERAIELATKRFGVAADQIELKRTGGGVLTRVADPNEEDVEILSLHDYTQREYPPPVEGDKFYKEYNKFGYGVYLINAYPEVWKQSDITWADIQYQQRVNYNWYCVATVFGLDENNITDDALQSLLTGERIVISKTKLQSLATVRLSENTPGVLLWEEGAGLFCLFFNDDGLLPLLCKQEDVTITNDVFDGWE